MELMLDKVRIKPGDVDINAQIGTQGAYVCEIDDSELTAEKLAERWTFYYPLSPDFQGTMAELKLLTTPGDGYVPERPWCTFPRADYYDLNIFLDLTPYTIYET